MEKDINQILLDILKTKPKIKSDGVKIRIYYSDYDIVINYNSYGGKFSCNINGFEQKSYDVSKEVYYAYEDYGKTLYKNIDVLRDTRNKKFDKIHEE